ncbi:MAG: hypothetical protein KKD38_10295 [Candidatus Delongbacteria bacterium]|nr:hypothetical protein [Candidatus Delongbacteria bacterium]MCG2759924.1 hypothetical protein [Candidatus Delongbacteria bacterium]
MRRAMIISTTVVENYEMKKDRVVANSCAMLRNINYLADTYDGAKAEYYIKISAEIDEDEVLNLLKETAFTSDLTNKISDLVTSGMSAERSLRIGDALKNYYWAYLLVKCDEYGRYSFSNRSNKKSN